MRVVGPRLTNATVIGAILGYLVIFPLFIMLGATHRITEIQGMPVENSRSLHWQKRTFFFAYTPVVIIGNVMGIVGMGSSRHFRTPHGVSCTLPPNKDRSNCIFPQIFGLITMLLTTASDIVYFHRLRDQGVLNAKVIKRFWNGKDKKGGRWSLPVVNGILQITVLVLSIVCFFTGWTDIRRFSFCFMQSLIDIEWLIFATGMFAMLLGSSIVLLFLRLWLDLRSTNELDKGHQVSRRPGQIEAAVAEKQWETNPERSLRGLVLKVPGDAKRASRGSRGSRGDRIEALPQDYTEFGRVRPRE